MNYSNSYSGSRLLLKYSYVFELWTCIVFIGVHEILGTSLQLYIFIWKMTAFEKNSDTLNILCNFTNEEINQDSSADDIFLFRNSTNNNFNGNINQQHDFTLPTSTGHAGILEIKNNIDIASEMQMKNEGRHVKPIEQNQQTYEEGSCFDNVSHLIMLSATSPVANNPLLLKPSQSSEVFKGRYFWASTVKEVEDLIHQYSQDTFSHFVVAKKTKAYGSEMSVIDITNKFRIHWQSRDLTTTEECAVQIPFQGVPFIYIGEKAYMCHYARSKTKLKVDSTSLLDTESPKKHRSKLTRKKTCPVKIFVKQIAKFPNYKISHNSEYLRMQTSQKLRNALQLSAGKLEHVMEFVGRFPSTNKHSNHEVGQNMYVKEPIDPLLREQIIKSAWRYGEKASVEKIRDELVEFVNNQMFKGVSPPSKNRRRFYPSEKDIANYIYRSRLYCKLNAQDICQLKQCVNNLEENHPERKIHLNIDELVKDHVTVEKQIIDEGFLLAFQSSNQQRLLKRYGYQATLTEVTSCMTRCPFPLYCLYVATNVDYQCVYMFMAVSKTEAAIAVSLDQLLQWNPYFAPKFFVVDYDSDIMKAVNRVFAASTILISEHSRYQCWRNWLSDAENVASLGLHGDHLFERLESIADSYTEDSLHEAAHSLESSDVWKHSERLRDWFSTCWLAEAKKWVVGYRHEEFVASYHIKDSLTEHIVKMQDMHYSFMKNKKLCELITRLVVDEVPHIYSRYVSLNISDYERQKQVTQLKDIGSFLLNKPLCVVTHLQQELSEINGLYATQLQPGMFLVQTKCDPSSSHAVSFGDTTTLPSCICINWLKYKLPCKHMVCVFKSCKGWSWDMLSPMYTGNPTFNFDLSCFDKKDVPQTVTGGESNSGVSSSSIAPTRNAEVNTDLAVECAVFCRELSESVRHVRDEKLLQNVRVDLKLITNYVKIELTRLPVSAKRPATHHRSEAKFSKSNRTELKSSATSPDDIWINDDDLSIRLHERHRKEILGNFPLSVDVANCVQCILRRQFNDVTGLFDVQSLNDGCAYDATKNKRFIQLHLQPSNHWVAYGQIENKVHVSCCDSSSKSSITGQITRFLGHDSELSDNLVIVERSEPPERSHLCGVYAVAYCVAIALGIEPGGLKFNELELSSHLVEYLEDMCFSMFPLN